MFATSFRAKLIGWYVGLAAIVALAFIAIAAVVLSQVYAVSQRQALESVARQVRSIVVAGNYRTPKAFQALEKPLQRRFADTPVLVKVHAFPDQRMMTERFAQGLVFYRAGADGPPPMPPPVAISGKMPVDFQARVYGSGPAPPGLGGKAFFNENTVRISPIAGFLELKMRPEALHTRNGDIVMFIDPAKVNAAISRFSLASAFFFVLVLFIAWRIAEIVAAHTLAPLLRTTNALTRFAEGDFTPESVDTNDRSELGQLARAYNGAVAQITYAFEELSKAEEEMRQFVADAGHQLRTPLTVIMGHLSGLSARERISGDPAIVSRMLDEARRMKSLIDDLILLAKLEHPQTEKITLIDTNELATRVARSFSGFDEHRISVFTSDEPACVAVCESELFSAVAALVDNALKYAKGSPVSISVLSNSAVVTIEVEDDGPGLSDADRERIFDRFYRGETSAGTVGTGLGLAIVSRTVERAGGAITVENCASGGLCCRIVLPSVPTVSKSLSVASLV